MQMLNIMKLKEETKTLTLNGRKDFPGILVEELVFLGTSPIWGPPINAKDNL